MEEMIVLLHAYGRFLELEDQIPYWQAQIPEKKARIRELEQNRKRKEVDLSGLENPNFFRKLLGRVEERKDRLNRQIAEITAALTAAQWELTDLEKKIAAGKQELETLAQSREAYEQAKRNAVLSAAQENQLMMEEIAAFLPAAMAAADQTAENLEAARFWMQKDADNQGVSEDNRKLECLSDAEKSAVRLRSILEMMPEGAANIGSYLQSPSGFITGVTSESGQLDRLNLAISQVQETKNQLSLLQ